MGGVRVKADSSEKGGDYNTRLNIQWREERL